MPQSKEGLDLAPVGELDHLKARFFGAVEEADVMSMADRPEGQPERPGHRLTRSRTDRKIAGVCGGIAAYTGIDANILRLLMVLFAVLGGGGVLVYLVAWAIIPEEDAGEAGGNGRL